MRLQCSIHQLCFVQKLISCQSRWTGKKTNLDGSSHPIQPALFWCWSGICKCITEFSEMNSSSKALVLSCWRPPVSVLVQLWCRLKRGRHLGALLQPDIHVSVICIGKFTAAECISGKAALYQKISFRSTTGYNFK